MYIKQVVIQGFKSYRDQTAVEPFSPRHNVVVGRNGSGKSNFFSAIQFVLSDEFSHMGPEERQRLLHEGTGARVVSAFVEIIFDNSDHRLPVEKDEVSLRRDVGAKKDTYYLEKRQVTRTDVMNLLETAGFSKSNPYYIVKQGKITQLATATDPYRLKLLREVAGTRVYDEKREESRGALQEAESKRTQITELLESIEERLGELEEEKEELREYQKWDKMHRSIEYTIHEKELRETRSKIDALTDQHDHASHKSRDLHKKVMEAQAKTEALDSDLKECGMKLSTAVAEKSQLEEELKELVKSRAKMEMDMRDMEKRVAEDESTTVSGGEELVAVEEQIRLKTAELDQVLRDYSELQVEQDQCSSRLRACEQRRAELYAKQGRGQQFGSREERDVWIKKEAKSLSSELQMKEKERVALQAGITELKERLQRRKSEEQDRGTNLDGRRQDMEKAGREYSQLKLQRDELSNERKELWRRDAAVSQSIQATKDELHRWEKALRGTMTKAIGRGLESLNRIVEEKHLQGVYGPLIQLISCHPRYFTPIEVTAGNKLFQVVVDSDHTASRIMACMNKEKLPGEITFLPLSILKPPSVHYPETEEAVALVSKLQYNDLFDPAVKRVFGKTLVCRTLEAASQLAKSDELDCVTLDGDQVSRRGALTGGYQDARKSRMEAWRRVDEQKKKLEAEEAEKHDIASKVQDLDGRITGVVSGMERLEARRVNLKETYEKQRVDVMSISRELQHTESSLKQKERSLTQVEAEVQSLQSTLASLQGELGAELHSQLEPSDQREVERLNRDIHGLQQDLRAVLDRSNKLEPKKNMLETLLTDNLEQRREELKKMLESISVADREQQLVLARSEYQHVLSSHEHAKQQFDDLSCEVEQLNKKRKEQQKEMDKWKSEERHLQDQIAEDSKAMEHYATRRSLLLKKQEQCMKKIRELGSLPSDTFSKYQKTGLKELWKQLHRCNEELRRFSHVNKKALDQYVHFTEQREKLIGRKEEVDRAHHAIVDLMDHLERKKDEAIQFTFRQVSRNFTEIFEELAPGGTGRLEMKLREMPADSESSASGASRVETIADTYEGVAIQVSFTGLQSEMKSLEQLSGGQKTLVALAFIFAIQKCDPGPFYLFDEIDAALDAQHRKSVADLIQRLSESAQFITTTFRPELLESADKCYGVRFRGKVSHIDAVSSEDAKSFLEGEGSVEK